MVSLYQPDSRRPQWVRAGHLPPVLLRVGRASPLPTIGGLLIGALDHGDYKELDNLLTIAQMPTDLKEAHDLERRLDLLLRHTNADTDDGTCLIGVRVN